MKILGCEKHQQYVIKSIAGKLYLLGCPNCEIYTFQIDQLALNELPALFDAFEDILIDIKQGAMYHVNDESSIYKEILYKFIEENSKGGDR